MIQFHFHSVSEHTINGNHYDLEMHLVRQDEKGHLLVVGVMFEKGKASTELGTIVQHLPKKVGGIKSI